MDIESDSVGEEWGVVNRNTSKPQGGGGHGGDEISIFMELKEREEPYRVRLICAPCSFRKHWGAFKGLRQFPVSPATEVEEKDLDIAWRRGGHVPRKRFVALVLDREHDSKIRVLEGGPQIFKPFSDYTKMAKKNPAGPAGPDWLISVGVGDNKQVQYSCMQAPDGPRPFNEAEVKAMNASKLNREWMVEKLITSKRATPEEIEELWNALSDDVKYADDKARQRDMEHIKKGTLTKVGSPKADVSEGADEVEAASATQSVKDDGFLRDEDDSDGGDAAEEQVASEPQDSGDNDKPAELF